jgi:hypothetical protein
MGSEKSNCTQAEKADFPLIFLPLQIDCNQDQALVIIKGQKKKLKEILPQIRYEKGSKCENEMNPASELLNGWLQELGKVIKMN